MAREYRLPLYQHLASWDHALGAIQRTRATTPHGEQLLFELGGYAYCWFDASVPDQADASPLSYYFKSVGEAYMRESWRPADLLVGVAKDRLVVHAGGEPIIATLSVDGEPVYDSPVDSISDNGTNAVIRSGASTNQVVIELNRKERTLHFTRHSTNDFVWYCPHAPKQAGESLKWGAKTTLQIGTGNWFGSNRTLTSRYSQQVQQIENERSCAK